MAVILGVVHLVGVVPKWWPTEDSGLYLSLARSLAAGDGYQFNGQPSSAVSPGLPLILAGIMKLPGGIGQSFVAANLLITACGLGVLWLAYLGVSKLSDRRTALAVVIVTGFSYRFYQNSHRILSDMPAALAVWAMLYASLRYQTGRTPWVALAAIMSAAAIVIRLPSALVIGPFAAGILLDRSSATRRGRRLLAALAILAAAVIAWRAWITIAGGIAPGTPGYSLMLRPEQRSGLYWLSQPPLALYNLMESMAEYLTGQEMTLIIGLPAVAAMAVGMVTAWRAGRRFAPAAIVLFLVATVLVTGDWAIRERYMIAYLPIFLLTMLEGVAVAVASLSRRRAVYDSQMANLVTVSVLTVLFVLANAPRTMYWAFYYSYLSYTPRYYEKIAHGNYRELMPACDVVSSHSDEESRTTLIGVNQSLVHFLSQRIVDVPLDSDGMAVEMLTDADADFLLDQVARPDAAGLIMVNLRNTGPAFSEKFAPGLAGLRESGRLELLYNGRDYQVYRHADVSGG